MLHLIKNIFRKQRKKPSIDYIVKQEAKLINDARKELGDIYNITLEFLVLLMGVRNATIIFMHFQMQVISSLHLAFISIVRRHLVQTGQMTRYAMESIALASYSLKETDGNKYGKITGDEFTEVNHDIKIKAYNFLKENDVEFSNKMTELKKILNDFIVHSNISAAANNFVINNNKFIGLHFDNYTKLATKVYLIGICELIKGYLLLLFKLKKTYDSFTFEDNFEKQFNKASLMYDEIYNKIVNSKEYIKMMKDAKQKGYT